MATDLIDVSIGAHCCFMLSVTKTVSPLWNNRWFLPLSQPFVASAKEVIFSLCLFVVTLTKNYRYDCYEPWWEGV